MLWDVWEYIIDLFNMTVKPALRNLFSSKRFFAGMILTIFILQTLLCVICLAGLNTIIEQNNILNVCSAYIAYNSDNNEELLKQVEVLSDNTSIFVGALCIWWLCAMTIYFRMASSSAEKNKYSWGLYITFGAQKHKIRKMLLTELYLSLGIGMIFGFPVAYLICRYGAGKEDLIAIGGALLLALFISAVSIHICAEIGVRLITAKTCTLLLSAEGSAGSIVSPKRSGKLSKGYSALRYASTVFFRLRKYYISVAVTAAIPVVIWTCCMTASVSEAQILQEEVEEFYINSSIGFEGNILQNEYLNEIEDISGVTSAWSLASGNADALGTHALLYEHQHSYEPGSYVPLPAIWADRDAYIADAYDLSIIQHTGFTAEPKVGEVVLVMPTNDTPYNFSDVFWDNANDAYIMISVSNDGNVEIAMPISDESSSNYLRLRVSSVLTISPNTIVANGSQPSHLYIEHPYVLLHTDDFERITSMSVEEFRETVSPSRYTIDKANYTDGSFLITIKGGLKTLPNAGDAILVEGSTWSADITASAQGHYEVLNQQTNKFDVETYRSTTVRKNFNTLYINDILEQNGDTILRVSPCISVTIHRFIQYPVALFNTMLLGTPKVQSDMDYGSDDSITYVATTYDQPFSVQYHELKSSNAITIYRQTSVKTRDINSCILFEDGRIYDTSDKVKLPALHATNDFTLACADSLTTASIGINTEIPQDDQAVIVLPENNKSNWTLENEQYIQIAYVPQTSIAFDKLDLIPVYHLMHQLDAVNYKYKQLTVKTVEYSENIQSPLILVSESTYSSLLGKDLPYSTITVNIDPDLKLDEYKKLKNELIYWGQITEKNNGEITVSNSNNYFDILLRKSADYSIWLKIISILIPFIIIPAWYYPQSMMFARRKDDYVTLFKLGKTLRNIRKLFAIEALMATALALSAILIICPFGIIIFDLIVDYFDLPIEFRISSFNFTALIIGCIIGTMGSFITVWRGYFTVRKEIKKNGNS